MLDCVTLCYIVLDCEQVCHLGTGMAWVWAGIFEVCVVSPSFALYSCLRHFDHSALQWLIGCATE